MKKSAIFNAFTTLVFAVSAVSFYSPKAYAAPNNNNVTLVSSAESSANINSGQQETLTAIIGNTGGNVADILVDLEVHDANGNKVAQQYWDNQLIPPTAPVTYHLTTPNDLNSGKYYFSVGLFHTGWSGLISWFGDVQTFTINSNTGGSPASVVLNNSVLSAINGNHCPNLTVMFANNSGVAQKVLIDIELYGAQGKVYQQYWDNYNAQPTSGNLDTLTSNCVQELSNGNYYYSVGIFNTSWNGLLHWYQGVQQFSISQNGESANIQMSSSSETASHIQQNQTDQFTAQIHNSGNTSAEVLVDIELHNSFGSKINQQFWDNQNINSGSTVPYSLTSPLNLPLGTYYFSVGLFHTGWNGLIAWYNAPQSFVVEQSLNGEQIFVEQVQRPKSNVTQGQSFTVTATLISQGGDATNVKIDLELVNSSTNQVADTSEYLNQTLVNNTPQNFSLTSNGSLPVGNYNIVIKIFNQDGSLKQQFNNLGSITVQ